MPPRATPGVSGSWRSILSVSVISLSYGMRADEPDAQLLISSNENVPLLVIVLQI
jgi:hypothetical protein